MDDMRLNKRDAIMLEIERKLNAIDIVANVHSTKYNSIGREYPLNLWPELHRWIRLLV